MIENKELNKFYKEIQEEIKSSLISEEDGASPEQLFTEYALAILAENGETENYRVSYDEKISKRGTEHKVNGYALYENYETLDLFISNYNPSDDIQTISKPDADKALDRLTKFFRNTIYKDYVNEIEESSEIFDLAQTLTNVKEVNEYLTRVNIFLITNGEVKSETLNSAKVAGYPVFYRIIDIHYLYNLSEKSGIPIEISFAENQVTIPCIEDFNDNEDYQSYLAIIPGHAPADIYEQYGPRLLEQNVRSFLQFTGKINKGIRKTILEEPHMFLAFNNGIAATAEEIRLTDMPDKKGKAIEYVKDFQIVNGGQTTASIYHTWKKNKADISKIFVQLKLTIIKDRENFGEIVGRIAEYANTQNKVSASDLSSNRENHVILEKLSRTIWAPPKEGEVHQTRWFFERSRGQYRNEKSRFGITPSRRKQFEKQNPRKQMFTKEQLAKYVNTYKEVYKGKKLVIGPHIVVRGSQKNYSQFLNYNFNDKPDNIFFEDIIALGILFKSAETIYGVKPNALGDMRYIIVPYAISYLSYITNNDLDLYKIWKKQRLSDDLASLLELVMIKIEDYIKNNAPGSLYGEWAKKEECWLAIKDYDFGINTDTIQSDLAENKEYDRRRLSNDDTDSILQEQKLRLIKSINYNNWKLIGSWGRESGYLSHYQLNIIDHIVTKLKLGKPLTKSQIENATLIIELINDKKPSFFSQQIEELNSSSSIKLNKEVVSSLLRWNLNSNQLKESEVQVLKLIEKGSKSLINKKTRKIADIILKKSLKKGFKV
jgi:hypothetical protein